MTNELSPNDVRSIWQNQAVEVTQMTLEDIREGTGKLEAMTHKRNLRGGIACIIVMASFGLAIFALPKMTSGHFSFTVPNLIQRIGAALTVIGAGYMAYQLLLIRRRPEGATATTEPAAGLRFYRAELERQRDFHRGLWFWSRVVIFTPGPLVFCVGLAIAHPNDVRPAYIIAAVLVLEVILGIRLNLGLARRYQREIDTLDAAEKQN
jgi:hypothetical protein